MEKFVVATTVADCEVFGVFGDFAAAKEVALSQNAHVYNYEDVKVDDGYDFNGVLYISLQPLPKKYYVFGGQYRSVCYGGADTLLGAKRLANKNQEYWDNWQGWHTPEIYFAEDCEMDDDGVHLQQFATHVNWATGQRYNPFDEEDM